MSFKLEVGEVDAGPVGVGLPTASVIVNSQQYKHTAAKVYIYTLFIIFRYGMYNKFKAICIGSWWCKNVG